jgi:nanoRNase/pAp phosphatase (c-di-AMP/oligoRNAs hydrolase)
MGKGNSLTLMRHPFPKSVSVAEKLKRLREIVVPDDALGILIDADPDAIASAMALKRIFWRKARRVSIYHINTIQRPDNLAMIELLNIELQHVKALDPSKFTKWALVDSQPSHSKTFTRVPLDIIVDHHPPDPQYEARFVDVMEHYGAASTVTTEYLRAARVRPSMKLATALFYGIKTDTDNFVRASTPNDINAFRYLYRFANMNIIKKVESSEMTRQMLASFRLAMDRLTLWKDVACIHMGQVDNADTLVMIADFFMKFAEASWSIVSGTVDRKLIVIFRNAGLRGNAGKTAKRLLGELEGAAGGHRAAARAEIQVDSILKGTRTRDLGQFVMRTLKRVHRG